MCSAGSAARTARPTAATVAVSLRDSSESTEDYRPSARASVNTVSFAPQRWLLGAVDEVVEQGHTVSLGPHPDLARVLERFVTPVQRALAVQHHGEVIPLKIDAQGVPLISSDSHPRSLRFGTPPVDRVVDRHVVLERIGARDVIVIGIPGPPDQPAGLILAAG